MIIGQSWCNMIYLHGIGHFHPENVITNRFWRAGDRDRRGLDHGAGGIASGVRFSPSYIRQTKAATAGDTRRAVAAMPRRRRRRRAGC